MISLRTVSRRRRSVVIRLRGFHPLSCRRLMIVAFFQYCLRLSMFNGGQVRHARQFSSSRDITNGTSVWLMMIQAFQVSSQLSLLSISMIFLPKKYSGRLVAVRPFQAMIFLSSTQLYNCSQSLFQLQVSHSVSLYENFLMICRRRSRLLKKLLMRSTDTKVRVRCRDICQ